MVSCSVSSGSVVRAVAPHRGGTRLESVYLSHGTAGQTIPPQREIFHKFPYSAQISFEKSLSYPTPSPRLLLRIYTHGPDWLTFKITERPRPDSRLNCVLFLCSFLSLCSLQTNNSKSKSLVVHRRQGRRFSSHEFLDMS